MKSKLTPRGQGLLHTILPLLFGSLIYLLFRPDNILLFHWLEQIGARERIDDWRAQAAWLTEYLPGWLLFSLPNSLWTYSFAIYFTLLWRDHRLYYWVGLTWAISLLGELLQLFSWLPGTFSLIDLMFIIIAIVCSYFYIYNFSHKT